MFALDANIPKLKKILIDANLPVICFNNGDLTNNELILFKVEFLFVRSTIQVNKELLNNTRVKFIATATTGIDHIDAEYLQQKNIEFYTPVGSNSNSVAEYVITSMLYANQNDFKHLQTKLVGIVGYGNIGSKVAAYLQQMGISFIVCDPYVEKNPLYSNINFCDIDQLISQADIITLHIPLTKNCDHPTLDLINKNRINKLKENTILINTSRGGICNEQQLLNKNIYCIIDTWENEPLINNRELITKSIIATPHIAGHSYEAKINATKMIVNKINDIYGFNLNSNITQCEKKKNDKIDMTDYWKLFSILNNNYHIDNTNNQMKQNANLLSDEFKKYFQSVRKNYPKIYEVLN